MAWRLGLQLKDGGVARVGRKWNHLRIALVGHGGAQKVVCVSCLRKLRLWFHLRQRWDVRERNYLRRHNGVAPERTGIAKIV